MAFWNESENTSINIGVNVNDGTGDVIRDAFRKVDNNFANISSFLGESTGPVDFLNANVSLNTNLNFANITNMFVANATGTTSNFTGNSTAGNVIATTGLYSQGTMYTGNIIPLAVGTYNLGSPTKPFANLYVQNTVSTTQINQSSDSGILKIHANAFIGDVQDTGILGNVTSDYNGSNTYAFFGHQYTTNNFIYKITDNDATKGNNIVVGGVYGNVQFGSAFLSNSTPSTSASTGALIVAGGAGISGNLTTAGNINSAGNIYSGGFQVITTNTPGINNLYSGGNVFSTGQPLTITNATDSTNTGTGAVILSAGGLGVHGNIFAGGIVGPFYGVLQTAAQPNITSVGTLSGLQVATSIGAASLSLSGAMSGFTLSVVTGGASISGNLFNTGTFTNTGGITATGNIVTSGNIIASGIEINSGISSSGNVSASNFTTTGTASVGTLTATGNINASNLIATQVNANLQGTILTANQPNITGVSTSANLAVASVYSNNYRFANGTPYVSTSIANTSEITANSASGGSVGLSLTTTGVTAGTYGNASSIATFVTDSKGRITSAANVAIATTLNISGTSGTGNVSLLTQGLTIVGGTDISTTASAQTVTIAATSTLATVTGRGASTTTALTLANITVGNITPAGNLTANIGSSTAWFNNIYGTATHALYADLAENYQADSEYAPGTVLVFGGEQELSVTTQSADTRVAGVVSTKPAHLMNGGLTGPGVVALALRGRVPVQVVGPVRKGDLLVTAEQAGYAQSTGNGANALAVFAKSLVTDLSEGAKVIEAVIL
jgi:hypothetical protein